MFDFATAVALTACGGEKKLRIEATLRKLATLIDKQNYLWLTSANPSTGLNLVPETPIRGER